MRRNDAIGLVVVALCLIFAITISLYHISYGETLKKMWIFCDNGLPLVLSLYVSFLTRGFIKIFFRWVFPPYFVAKLVYHLSCVVGVYLMPQEAWEGLWSVFVVSLLVSGIIYCLILYKSQNEV